MEVSILQFPDVVRLAPLIFERERQTMPMQARSSGLFREMPIPANSGNTREFSDIIETEKFAKRKGEGEQAAHARVKQGYKKIARYARVGLDLTITHEAMTLNKYPEIFSGLVQLSRNCAARIELDLQHRIGFGKSTAYTNQDGESVDIATGDTLALFSAVHTLTGSSTTYRNILAGNPQFSRGALEGMERLVNEETYNNFGQLLKPPPGTFDILWYADDPTQENLILEFIKSTSSVQGGTNNGVINVFSKKYRPVCLSWIATDKDGGPDSTKRKFWGVASSSMSQAHFAIWEEPYLLVPPSSDNNATNRETEDATFGARAAYDTAITSAFWIKMSDGTGV